MCVWAFDIECEDWDRLVVGRAVSTDGDVVELDTYGSISSWYWALPPEDLVLSHVGGRYDFLCLLAACGHRGDWRGTCAGASLVSLRARGHAECRDTYAIVPQSLAAWSGMKTDTGLTCDCGRDCGGYCAIRRDMPAPARRRLAEYCVQDCRALLSAWDALLDYADLHDLPLCHGAGGTRRTVGSVSWALAKEYAGAAAYTWGRYDLEREAYYGGRCEVFRPYAARLERYDLNSAYPWALTLPVPIGEPSALAGCDAVSAWRDGAPGLYRAVWRSDNDWIPPLPRRGRGRLVWAAGDGVGWYARPELAAAIVAGADVTIEAALVYDGEMPVYAELMRRLFDMRQAAGRRWGAKCWQRAWVKRIANTISGKLAQGTDSCSIRITDAPEEGWRWLGGRAWAVVTEHIPSCARPAQAAYLTARVRARLLRVLSTSDPAYCDTDSCYADSGRPDIVGDGLGEWQDEGPADNWIALAPKVYRYNIATGAKVKAKGFSGLDSEGFGRLERGISWVVDRGVEGIRTAGPVFRRKHLVRALRLTPGFVGFRAVQGDGRATAPIVANGRITWRSGRKDVDMERQIGYLLRA